MAVGSPQPLLHHNIKPRSERGFSHEMLTIA